MYRRSPEKGSDIKISLPYGNQELERYWSIFSRINSGIAVYQPVDHGRDFIIRDMNRAQEKIEGLSRKTVCGKRLTEVIPGIRNIGLLDVLRRVWETGKPEVFSTSIYQGGKLSGAREHQVFKLPNGELAVVHEDVGPLIQEIRQAQKTEEHIRAIFRAADKIAFVITDLGADIRIQEFSPGAEKIFGYTRDQVLGKPLSILHLPNYAERIPDILSSMGSGEGVSEECTLSRSTGDSFPALLSAYPILNVDGDITGALWAAVDLTNIRMAETALRASEERFRTYFENAVVGMAMLDPEGNFIKVNGALCSILGYSAESLLNMSIWNIIVAEDLPCAEEKMKAVLNREVDFVQFENRYKHQNGHMVWCLMNCSLIRDPVGRPSYLIAQLIDITKRVEAVQALKNSHERFTTVMDSIEACVYVLDLNSHEILFANRKTSETFGPWTGKKCYEVFQNGQTSVCGNCTHEKLIKPDGSPSGVHVCEFRNTLNKQWYELRIQAIRWVDGRLARMVIATDITDRKNEEDERRGFEQRIHQAQRLESLGVLAGGIAHDFNNLLMGILGHADMALMKLPPESPARSSVQKIEMAALRAAELTNQMLAYSGKGRFIIESLDLSKIVEEMGHLLETVISKKAVLKYNFTRNLPPIQGDAAQIRQVIMNLITNSSDAIGENSGIITISTGVMEADHVYLSETYLDDDLVSGYYVYIEVSDTGCGMDEETRSRIFDPFFSTKFSGRGLGLAAVLGIIRGHRGAIKVYSEPGRGTTFKILFPCDKTESLNRPHGCDEESATGLMFEQKKTVLVVDDDETVRTVVKMMLEEAGFRVITAVDGVKALDLFREQGNVIDLVLLDMTMPHMNGEETFRELRRIDPHVRVILSSGYNEQDATDRFAGKGLAGFIQKPFRSAMLMKKIKEALQD